MKTAKRIIAIVLSLALLVALAACGSTGGGEAQTQAQTEAQTQAQGGGENEGGEAGGPSIDTKYTIGFNQWGSGAEVFDWQSTESKYVIEELLGMTLNNVSDEFTADGTLKNVQNFCASGVDGIMTAINQPSSVPQCTETIKQAEIPFLLTIMCGEPDQRDELKKDNPFYLGAFDSDTYYEGYTFGKIAIEAGCKTALLCMGNFGELTSENRIIGFTKSFVEEGGGEILDIARPSAPPDAQSACSSMLSAHRDADCVFGGSGDYAPGILAAMENLQIDPKEMPIYVCHSGLETTGYVKEGKIRACSGGDDILVHLTICSLINALDGHPILDDNGEPPFYMMVPFIVTQDNVDQYIDLYFSYATTGKHVYSPETIKSLLWRYNPDVTYADFVEAAKPDLDNLAKQTW